MPNLKRFLENSQNNYTQYLCASAIKTLLTDYWLKIQMNEKIAIKKYLVNYLMQTEVVIRQDKQVVKMMMLLLAKIAKLAWFDDPEIKNGLVIDLSKILHIPNEEHKLIGLQALD